MLTAAPLVALPSHPVFGPQSRSEKNNVGGAAAAAGAKAMTAQKSASALSLNPAPLGGEFVIPCLLENAVLVNMMM